MTREKQILALTCLFVVLPILVTAECPSKEDIAPCICKNPFPMWGIDVECDKIDNGELARVASHLGGRKIGTLVIEDSTLGSIPYDVFKGIKLRYLSIRDSTLSSLTDGSEAFVGLEDQLEKLRIWNCVYKSKWDWSVLRNLRKLEGLHIFKSIKLETIGEDLMKSSLSSVKTFEFSGNNISFVYDHAFDSFKNIESLSLDSNNIKNVKRTMLPNPALKLWSFSLSHNEIEYFPEDMFTHMPYLKALDLDGNKILVLEEKTLSPVWEKLNSFRINGNPLRCDCRMSWLLEKRVPIYDFSGACASPPELKGKKLRNLKSNDFVCTS